MIPFLAYVPYAVAGYCAMKVAADTWPSLKGQLGTPSHISTRRGMDGERTHARLGPATCAAIARNPSLAAAAAKNGCYDESTRKFVGGQYDGATAVASQVSVYLDDGVRLASIHLGDNRIVIPTCAQPGGLSVPPGGPGGETVTPPGETHEDECGPRRLPPRGSPDWRYCGDDNRAKRINARRRRR